MFRKEKLLKQPNYLLTKYQNEIYRQLQEYMVANNLTQKDVAERLGVSNAYVSQILNGNFNFTLKKLIEIGLMIGKVPAIEFVDSMEFWRRQKEGSMASPTISVTTKQAVYVLPVQRVHHIHIAKDASSKTFAQARDTISLSEIEYSSN